jgi:starch synthase (maltosyl-transferring)
MYSGYELYEHVAVQPGSEEYLGSEKYQYRPRDWAAYAPSGPRAGETLAPYITRLNDLRRSHPALRKLRNLQFHHVDNPDIICFSKREGEDCMIVVVNLDPHAASEATVSLDMPALGFDWHETFSAHDELTGATYPWSQHNYVRLDPATEPAHILTVRRWGP